MRICTYKECADWCVAHGYSTCNFQGLIGRPEPDLTEADFSFAMFSIPDGAGPRVALMKQLVSLIEDNSELFVQIGDWGVWEDHMPLFDRFRQAFGERRPLIEAPGHVIPASERDDAVSILVISVLYLWNCHVLSAEGDQALFISHDEFGWFAVRGARSLDPAIHWLQEFGVLTSGDSAT